jgi:hypothetical protein
MIAKGLRQMGIALGTSISVSTADPALGDPIY